MVDGLDWCEVCGDVVAEGRSGWAHVLLAKGYDHVAMPRRLPNLRDPEAVEAWLAR